MERNQKKYFEYLAGRSQLGLWYRTFWLYPRICRHLNGRVLDVGCGIGDFVRYRQNTVGADINSEVVDFCKSHGLDVFKMNEERLPFSSREFDGVVMDNVLEHIKSPKSLLKEIHRVLKPAGDFIVGVPGWKGFLKDSDHKNFYDQVTLERTIRPYGFSKVVTLYTPLHSSFLDRNLAQYCLYMKFIRD